MIKAKRSLGQHFLKDDNILRKIVGAIPEGASGADRVLEIGAGTGALTTHLLERFNQVTAVEVDSRAVEHLQTRFPDLDVMQRDVLDVKLSELPGSDSGLNIVGNLPYNITSPILFQMLDHSRYVSSAVLLIQEEVARRLIAEPRTKDYGILTVQHQVMADVEYLFKVSRNVFQPRPKVDSAVVRITYTHPELPCSLSAFKRVVRTGFNQRRKKLSNALKPTINGKEGMDKLKEHIDLTRRAEELSPNEYVKMTQIVEEYDILT